MSSEGPSTRAVQVAAGVAALPLLAAGMVLLALGGAGSNAATTSSGCGAGGTGQTITGIRLDAEQMSNAQTIVAVTASRQLPEYAAEIALTAAYTESSLHNSTVQTDHDSEGLFQQRVSIYTKQMADDPVRATAAFLDRLSRVADWRRRPVGVDAQAVQRSAYPGRYQPNTALAAALAGRFWPAAAADAPGASPTSGTPSVRRRSTSTSAPDAARPAVCAGAGGAGTIVGPSGDTVAGTTRIPAGFVISGSAQGQAAVRFALAQLGKPYVFGAAGPDSFDCSGLTMAAWAAAGVALPHLAADQAHAGTPEPIDLSQAVAGDLVFVPGADGTAAAPGHVGMVAGAVTTGGGRRLFVVQAAESGVPVELTPATRWAASGQIVAARHIA